MIKGSTDGRRLGFPLPGRWHDVIGLVLLAWTLCLPGRAQPKEIAIDSQAPAPRETGASAGVPAPLTPYPRTPLELLGNIIHLAEGGLEADDDFYTDASLKRLFNAVRIDGVRNPQDIDLLFEFACAPRPFTFGQISMPGASERVSRSADQKTGGMVFLINLTIHDPDIRPAYASVEALLGADWNDWDEQEFRTVPLPPHRLPDTPSGPPRNRALILRRVSALHTTVLQLRFDPAGKLQL